MIEKRRIFEWCLTKEIEAKAPPSLFTRNGLSDRVLDLKSLVTMTKRVFGLKLFGIYFIVIYKVGYKLF